MKKVAGIALTAGLVGFGMLVTTEASAEDFKLRIASGHASVATWVNLTTTFFVPEVTKRVAERTDHTIEFIEAYGGALVKPADVFEGVQSGIVDIGGYCFCFEPSSLPMHAFPVMLPFGTPSAATSVKVVRAVYDKVPYMTEVFEDKFNQKLIMLSPEQSYQLGTTFAWDSVKDLEGRKIAGAGLNLKWLESIGVVPVQSTLPDAYTGLQTGVYEGWIMFPSAWVQYKLYEVGKYFTETDFLSSTWMGWTINKARWDSLPKEVQDIIMEVGSEYEARIGSLNDENYSKQIEEMKANGVTIKRLDDNARQEWAVALKDWPQQKATELDGQGLPASEVLKLAIEEQEKNGHKWPVRYVIE
jgi:TRAP-type C4-dicarboxylate transport system substrate-binding protein